MPGQDVRLTLDANIQDHTEEVLAEVGEQWQPKGATALVMDPRDGSILALANWPRVNANKLYEAPDYAMTNRATGATYEPGSTFKAFTVAGALEDGKVTPDDAVHAAAGAPGRRPRDQRRARARLGDARRRAASSRESSNVGAALIGRTLGATRFDQWVRRFGFGKPTGRRPAGRGGGHRARPTTDYSGSTAANMAMGQGLAVTPMQMAAGYAAIANGGILRPPHIVDVGRRPRAAGRRRAARDLRARRRPRCARCSRACSARAARRPAPRSTATSWAARPARRRSRTRHGGYSKTKFVASFVGFAPARTRGCSSP